VGERTTSPVVPLSVQIKSTRMAEIKRGTIDLGTIGTDSEGFGGHRREGLWSTSRCSSMRSENGRKEEER